MNYVVFDIETQNTFEEVGSTDVTDLDISVVSVYEKNTDKVLSFEIKEFSEMWPIFERADAIVGYNSEHFDIPLLNKYYSGDLNQLKSIDLMVFLKESMGKRPKLDNVAIGTLGSMKIAHGLQAVEWWKKGEIDKIKKYCEEDVMITKKIFEYALKNKSLKVKAREGDRIDEVQIDTSTWEDTSDSNAITKSLF
jgi:DEAD/DEAH box helicase domain-containing protein